jgi:DeoR/GlpR family transcriptional regulator of sugar metabolism
VIGDVAICTLDKVDSIITDDAVDQDVRDELERLGIRQTVV